MVKLTLLHHRNTLCPLEGGRGNNGLCDTVMDIYDSDNSGFGYKSVHMEGNYHHSTFSYTDAVHIASF